jgi:hypothetical protein
VHIIFGILWDIEVNDEVDIFNIYSPAEYIGGYQRPDFLALKRSSTASRSFCSRSEDIPSASSPPLQRMDNI